MAEDVEALIKTLSAIVDGLGPAQRRRAMRAIGAEVRRAQAQRIAAQTDPEGAPFVPRKPRLADHHRGVAQRASARRGKTARKAMFAKLRTARYLKARTTADSAEIGFSGRAARIARVHQEGLRDKVDPKRSTVEAIYPVRRLLGLAGEDRERALDRLLQMVAL